MLFNSLRFLVFFPVVYAAYLLLPHRWQNRMLLLASYVFYASWDWRFVALNLEFLRLFVSDTGAAGIDVAIVEGQ